jgi:hypothetical protein
VWDIIINLIYRQSCRNHLAAAGKQGERWACTSETAGFSGRLGNATPRHGVPDPPRHQTRFLEVGGRDRDWDDVGTSQSKDGYVRR